MVSRSDAYASSTLTDRLNRHNHSLNTRINGLVRRMREQIKITKTTTAHYGSKIYFYHVAFPIAVAASIYLFLRPVKPFLLEMHPSLTRPFLGLPDSFNWVIYNLPDGLWAYSFFSFMRIVTIDESTKVRSIYLKLSILLMIGYEFAQTSFVVGTFDMLDVIAIAAGICCSVFTLRDSK
jgi:hypothetical protein